MWDTFVGGVIGIIGGLAGAAFGVWFQNLWRERGDLRCNVHGWKLDFAGTEQATFTFDVTFFNEKGIDTGLRDLWVVFSSGREQQVAVRPHDSLTGMEADVLNFPPRMFVNRRLKGEIREGAQKVNRYNEVKLVGYHPDGQPFRVEIHSLAPSSSAGSDA